MTFKNCLFGLIFILIIGMPTYSVAQTYEVKLLEFPASLNARSRTPFAINNRGQIVGTYVDGITFDDYGFVYESDSVQNLGLYVRPWDINDNGDIIYRRNSDYYLLRNGSETVLLGPNGESVRAYSINNGGTIVGDYTAANFEQYVEHALLITGGQSIDIGTLEGNDPSISSNASSLNQLGVIVGTSETSGTGLFQEPVGTFGFVYENGAMSSLGFLDTVSGGRGLNSGAADINSAGVIVGSAQERRAFSWPSSAVIWRDGKIKSLHPSVKLNSYATAINESGDVVGGTYQTGPLVRNAAWLWIGGNGTGVPLNSQIPDSPSVYLTHAYDINDCGQIICEGLKIVDGAISFDTIFSYLLTPQSVSTVNNPGQGELYIAGEKNAISWSICDVNGIDESDSVRISYSSNYDSTGGTFTTIVEKYAANAGLYIWDVPDSILSRKCAIKIEVHGRPELTIVSDVFNIKGYELTRVTAEDDYEPFLVIEDGWSFANASNNIWPQSYYQQFDYLSGTDPVTQLNYPSYFVLFPVIALSSDFPNWSPIMANIFGTSQIYVSNSIDSTLIPRPSVVNWWANAKGSWGGSCYGFATSSVMAFDSLDRYQTYFGTGSIGQLSGIPANDFSRDIINHLMNTQSGREVGQSRSSHWNDTPNQTLALIRAMLIGDSRQDATLAIYNQSGSGGHSLTPYRITPHESVPSAFSVWVYDSNGPNTLPRVIIDTAFTPPMGVLTGQWSFSPLGWGGSKGIIIDYPVENLYDIQTLPVSPGPVPLSTNRQTHVAADSMIHVFVSSDFDITISNTVGGVIGYRDSVAFDSLSGAIPIIPLTGGFHPPVGYYLPGGEYSAGVSDIADSVYSIVADFSASQLSYNRSDATPADSESFRLNSALCIVNPDVNARKINLAAIVKDTLFEYSYDISGLDLFSGDSAQVSTLDNSILAFANFGPSKTCTIALTRLDSRLPYLKLENTSVNLPANAAFKLLPVWDNLGQDPVTMVIDSNLDGTYDDTTSLLVVTDVDDDEDVVLPRTFALRQNFPNPFNPTTTISYSLPARANVTVSIFNVLGQRVKVFDRGSQSAGEYSLTWNATDDRGQSVGTGVYFYRIDAGKFVATRKMLFIR